MASALVDVYVKLPTGRTSVLHLLPTDQVRKINEQIGKEEGIPSVRVRMKYQGKILDKSKTVGYLGIRPETILKADVVIPKDIKVYVRVLRNGSVPVDIQNTSTLNNFKEAVERLDVVSPKIIQSFKHSGNTYHPSETPLFSTSIGEESVVEVICSDRKETRDSEVEEAPTKGTFETCDEDLKDTILSSFQAEGKNVEVVFSFDTTGSMSQYLEQVRKNLRETCQRLLRDIPNIRIGLMAHGDYCDYDKYVIKIQDLTSDVQQLVDFAKNTPSTGGGDAPECYEWVLYKAKQLDWSENSAKALVVIGDCEPHPPSYTDQRINWHSELDILKGMGVKVYGVHCASGMSEAHHFYEELAERTSGCLLKLANFSLITEMFLGVCYKESDHEQLEAFTEELKQEGKLTEETESLLKQLDDTKATIETDTSETPNYMTKHTYDWWNFDHDTNAKPMYSYNVENDTWKPCSSHKKQESIRLSSSRTSSTDTSSPISYSYLSAHKKKSQKRGCSIM